LILFQAHSAQSFVVMYRGLWPASHCTAGKGISLGSHASAKHHKAFGSTNLNVGLVGLVGMFGGKKRLSAMNALG